MTRKIGNVMYLTLQKTGCSFCTRVMDAALKKTAPCSVFHKTNKALSDKLVYMINIRNPWDFYVSLFTYNVKTTGPDMKGVIAKVGGAAVTDFNLFVNTLLTRKIHHKQDNWSWVSSPKDLGLLSFRLMSFLDQEKTNVVVTQPNFSLIEQHFYSLVNNQKIFFLRQEDLFRQLFNAIEANEHLFGGHLLPDWKIQVEQFAKYKDFRAMAGCDSFMKIRKDDQDYRTFYDEKTKQLVAQQERLIIEHFGYKFK